MRAFSTNQVKNTPTTNETATAIQSRSGNDKKGVFHGARMIGFGTTTVRPDLLRGTVNVLNLYGPNLKEGSYLKNKFS